MFHMTAMRKIDISANIAEPAGWTSERSPVHFAEKIHSAIITSRMRGRNKTVTTANIAEPAALIFPLLPVHIAGIIRTVIITNQNGEIN